MKATVDDSCIGCGLCEDVCPEVFELRDDGLACVTVAQVPAESEGSAREAEETCPVDAIHLAD